MSTGTGTGISRGSSRTTVVIVVVVVVVKEVVVVVAVQEDSSQTRVGCTRNLSTSSA